jgi:hypothetical protein
MAFLALVAHSTSWAAKDVVDTNVVLSCAVSGLYADGTRIKTSGVEEISIEIKKINWNANEPSKPPAMGSMSNIKVKSGNKLHEASLLKSTKNRVAFSFAIDTEIDKTPQTLLFTYEISLETLKIRRTVLTLFTTGANSVMSFEGDCTRRIS